MNTHETMMWARIALVTLVPGCSVGDSPYYDDDDVADAADANGDSSESTSSLGSSESTIESVGAIESTDEAVDSTESTSESGDPPDPPVLELSTGPIKQFEFSWDPAQGADSYQLFESIDVGAPYVAVGEALLGHATSLTVPLHFRVHASYRLRACNEFGCRDSRALAVVGTLAEAVGYFKASNTDPGDEFGYSVALSSDGNTLAVGARNEASNSTAIDIGQTNDTATYAGAVYVFVRSGQAWTQQAYLKAANAGAGDHFGAYVALSSEGDTLAVGAYGEASAGDDPNDDTSGHTGAAYVFVRDGQSWTQQAYLKASNPDPNDLFGLALALSGDGDTLAVGARGEASPATGIDHDQAGDSAPEAGAVYVFVRSGQSWAQQAYVKASNTGAGDRFGAESLALSGDGNTLAVGAYGEDSYASGIDHDQTDDTQPLAGAVYVFARAGLAWTQQAYVKASNTDSGDRFGWSVALSGDGDTLAVGAFGEASNAIGVGADAGANDDSFDYAGAAYVFARKGQAWTQQTYVKASNTDANDYFGWSVALSADGSTLAVGAYGEDSHATGIGGEQADDSVSDARAVYVYGFDGQSWTQRAYVKAPNTQTSNFNGGGEREPRNLALSENGETLALGSLHEQSAATGVGGDQADNSAPYAGAVYLY